MRGMAPAAACGSGFSESRLKTTIAAVTCTAAVLDPNKCWRGAMATAAMTSVG